MRVLEARFGDCALQEDVRMLVYARDVRVSEEELMQQALQYERQRDEVSKLGL